MSASEHVDCRTEKRIVDGLTVATVAPTNTAGQLCPNTPAERDESVDLRISSHSESFS
jgi:hypothetical protein